MDQILHVYGDSKFDLKKKVISPLLIPLPKEPNSISFCHISHFFFSYLVNDKGVSWQLMVK